MGLLKNLGVWQNYAHYVLLSTSIILFSMSLGMPVESIYEFLKLDLILSVFIFIVDTLVHLGFAIAPKPIRWAD